MRSICGLLLVFALAAYAQDTKQSYPVKPIRLILPDAAGGGFDTVARALAAKLSEMMNRSYTAWQQASGDAKRPLATLNRDLATAYAVIESADAAPTAQAVKSVAALERRIAALVSGRRPM